MKKLILLVLITLGLSACQKERLTNSVDETAYCNEHPSECAVRSMNGGSHEL